MGLGALDWVFVGLAFGAIILFWWIISRGNFDRVDEDDARAFFDDHGHFPDEDPDEVAAFAERHNAEIRDAGEWDSDPRLFLQDDEDRGHDGAGEQDRPEVPDRLWPAGDARREHDG